MIAVWGIALVELVTVVGWTVSQTDTIAVARNKIEKLGGQIEIDGDTNEVKAIRLRSERISDKDLELLGLPFLGVATCEMGLNPAHQ